MGGSYSNFATDIPALARSSDLQAAGNDLELLEWNGSAWSAARTTYSTRSQRPRRRRQLVKPNATFAHCRAPPAQSAGDFNHDGQVDAADYVAWPQNLGSSYFPGHYNAFVRRFRQVAQGKKHAPHIRFNTRARCLSHYLTSALVAYWHRYR